MAWILNTLSGQVADLPDHIASHPTFSPYHVEVPAGTKSYEPTAYKPKTAEEYLAANKAADKKSEDKK